MTSSPLSSVSFPPSTPGHIRSLTGLRGLAALFVVVYHLSGGFLPNLSLGETMLLAKGYLAVDLFFLLSGFVMMHVYGRTFRAGLSRRDLSAFALARFARLYPLHVAMLLGFVLLECAKLALLAIDPALPDVEAFVGGRTLPTFLMHATMTHGLGLFPGPSWNGPAWSIGAEWVAYLAFPLLVLVLAQGGAVLAIALAAVLSAGLAFLGSSGVGLDVTYVDGLWRCLAEFGLGAILYRVHAGGWTTALGRDFLAFACPACLLAALHFGLADLLAVALMAVLILSLAESEAAEGEGRAAALFSGRAALFLGTVSYSVYMVHILLIEIANLTSRALTHAPLGVHLGQAGSLAVLVAGPALAVAAATVLHRRVELPGREAIKGWRMPWGRGAETERA